MNLLERCLFLPAKDAPVFLSLFSFAPGAAGCVFGVGAGRPPRGPDREDLAGGDRAVQGYSAPLKIPLG